MLSRNKLIVIATRVLGIIVIATIYFLAAKVGLGLALKGTNASPVWPPSGIALAAMMIVGTRYWPGIFIGAFFINYQQFLGNYGSGPDVLMISLFIATGNTLEGLAGSFLLKSKKSNMFDEARKVLSFAGVAVAASAISASFGALSHWLGGLAAGHSFFSIWSTWMFGDFSGILVITPVLLHISQTWYKRNSLTNVAPFAAYFILFFIVCMVVFGVWFPGGLEHTRVYIAFVLLVAFTFRRKLTQSGILLLMAATFAILTAKSGKGPFAAENLAEGLFSLQVFISVLSITILLLHATLMTRDRAENELLQSKLNLESSIQERTRTLEEQTLELARTNEQLKRFNEFAVGREKKIVELKEKLNSLEEKMKKQ